MAMSGPRIHFGAGDLSVLPNVLREHRTHSVLLVSGKSAHAKSGVEDLLKQLPKHTRLHWFSDFTTNPKIKQVEMAVEVIRQKRCDAVVGIGGGTALDIAKAAATLAAQPVSVVECLLQQRPLRQRRCLLILVPTTAGTGSEVTSFSTIYIDQKKHSLDDPAILADYALVDPDLTVGLPQRTAASAALDAISQAMESLWSVGSTESSLHNAREALRLGLGHIKQFCVESGPESRTAMSRAALLSGYAINVTRTTGPHAVSYALTALFNIPHGHGCALTLPGFILYNANVSESDVVDRRGVLWVKQRIQEIVEMLQVNTIQEGRAQLLRLIAETGLESRLSDLGLAAADIERIVKFGPDQKRASNNPRRINDQGLREVLRLSL
jgi:alcohol dehydrogenase class IV